MLANMRPRHETLAQAHERLFSQPQPKAHTQHASRPQPSRNLPFDVTTADAPHPAFTPEPAAPQSAISPTQQAPQEEETEPGAYNLRVAVDYSTDLNNFYPQTEAVLLPWLDPEIPFNIKSLAYMVPQGETSKTIRDARPGLIKGTRCQPGAIALEGRYEVIVEGTMESLGGMDKSVFIDFIPLGNHVNSLGNVDFRQFTADPKERPELGVTIHMGSNLATFEIKGEVKLPANVYALVLANRGKTERFPQRLECSVRIRHVDGPSHYAPEPPKLQAVGFQHPNYRGRATRLGVGAHNSTAFPNNQLSSIRVPEGLKVTLFDAGNFRGRNAVLLEDCPNLAAINFNDIVSSIIVDDVRDSDGPMVLLYTLQQFQGKKTTVRLGKHPIGTFHRHVFLSAQVPPGVEIVLYEKKGMAGHRINLPEGSHRDLRHQMFEEAPCGLEVRIVDHPRWQRAKEQGWQFEPEKTYTPDTLGNGFASGDGRRLTARKKSARLNSAHNKKHLDYLDSQRFPPQQGRQGASTPDSPFNPHRKLPFSTPSPGPAGGHASPAGRSSALAGHRSNSLPPRQFEKETDESVAASLKVLSDDIESARVTLQVQSDYAARRKGRAEETRQRRARLEGELSQLRSNHERAMAALSEAHTKLVLQVDQMERRGLAQSQPAQLNALLRVKQRHRLLKRLMETQHKDEVEVLELELRTCDRVLAGADSCMFDVKTLEGNLRQAEMHLKQMRDHFDAEAVAQPKPGQNPEYVYEVGLQLWDLVASAERVHQLRVFDVAKTARIAQAARSEVPFAEQSMKQVQKRIAEVNREIDLANRNMHDVAGQRHSTKRAQEKQNRKVGTIKRRVASLTKERTICQTHVPMFQDELKYAHSAEQAFHTAKAELREAEKQLEQALSKARQHDATIV